MTYPSDDIHAADADLKSMSLRQLDRRRERLYGRLMTVDGDERSELRELLEATDAERKTREVESSWVKDGKRTVWRKRGYQK